MFLVIVTRWKSFLRIVKEREKQRQRDRKYHKQRERERERKRERERERERERDHVAYRLYRKHPRNTRLIDDLLLQIACSFFRDFVIENIFADV